MIACDGRICDFFRYHRRADRKAIAKRFSRSECVRMRRDGEGLVRPKLTDSGQTTLDFIVDEDRIDLIAAVPERSQERRRGYIEKGFWYLGLGVVDNEPIVRL